jgi:hypothetical protein
MNIARRAGRLLAVAALAAAPALLALFLIGRCFQTGVGSFCPAYDVDQFLYAREAATFAAAGFDGGYYGGDGQKAVLGRFGPHGAAYPVLYGSLAKLCGGWRDYLSPVFNMVLVTLALALCARAMSLGALAALAVCMALFPPLVFYMSTAYQEALQIALGLGLGAALAGFAGAPSRRGLWRMLVLVLVASLTRPTWAVLFPAVLWCAGEARWRRALWALLGGGAALGAAYALFSLTASPWMALAGPKPGLSALAAGPAAVWSLLAANLVRLADFSNNRYQSLVLLLMLGGVLLAMGAAAADRQARLRALAVHACNFLAPFGLYLMVYTGSGRHLPRLLAAHGALSLAYAAASLPRRGRALVFAPVLAACLALLPATLGEYALYIRPAYDDFNGYKARIAAQAAAMTPPLSLSLGAPSPWLRTLALPTGDIAVPFLAPPAAYGLEIYTPEALGKPLKPGFALLSPAQYALAAPATPLTAVAETPAGTLYRNDAAFGFAPWPGGTP